MHKRRRGRDGQSIGKRFRPPNARNQIWSADFVMDALAYGRRNCLTMRAISPENACVDIAVDYDISSGTWLESLEAITHF